MVRNISSVQAAFLGCINVIWAGVALPEPLSRTKLSTGAGERIHYCPLAIL